MTDESRKRAIEKNITILGELLDKATAVYAEIAHLHGGGKGIGEVLAELRDHFDAVWCERHARGETGKYAWVYAEDNKHLKTKLQQFTPDEIRYRMSGYIRDATPFLTTAKHPFRLFIKDFNRYAPNVASAPLALVGSAPADCRHTPRCQDDGACTRKRNAERKPAARAATA